MSNTSIQVEISRLRAENRQREATLRALRSRLDESDRRARLSSIEAKVIRLEAEGYDLSRAEEVDRLSQMSDRDIEAEIVRIRKNYRQVSRRGFPARPDMLYGGNDPGGSGLPRRPTFDELNTPPVEDRVEGTKDTRIFGESVARLALELEEAGTPLVNHASPAGLLPSHRRRANPLRLARAAVKRFAAERSEVARG